MLDLETFQGIYEQYSPYAESDDYAALVFRVFDSDDASSIDFEDFIVALSVMTRGTLEEKMELAFKLYNFDRDGMISKSDMLVGVTAIYKTFGTKVQPPEDERTPLMWVEKMFGAMDEDGDGFLSVNDFREGCKRDSRIVEVLNLNRDPLSVQKDTG